MLNVSISNENKQRLREKGCYFRYNNDSYITLYNIYGEPLLELLYNENDEEIVVITREWVIYAEYVVFEVSKDKNYEPSIFLGGRYERKNAVEKEKIIVIVG